MNNTNQVIDTFISVIQRNITNAKQTPICKHCNGNGKTTIGYDQEHDEPITIDCLYCDCTGHELPLN